MAGLESVYILSRFWWLSYAGDSALLSDYIHSYLSQLNRFHRFQYDGLRIGAVSCSLPALAFWTLEKKLAGGIVSILVAAVVDSVVNPWILDLLLH